MSDTMHTPVEQDSNKNTWTRGLFMLIFIVLFKIAETVLSLLAVIQFFWLLFNKEPNASLKKFGISLGNWMLEVVDFQSCASDEKPFPWKEWPSAE